MLPATLAHDVKKQLLHYLGATFQMRLPENEQALQRFFNDPVNGLFKGPWVQVKRPFRLADDRGSQFFDLDIPFTPFRHQWHSWRYLSSKNNKPRHTLVTTGTGSGKTECFLFPLLDHCLRQYRAGKREGIKAIVLYPMNALAADQAGRFAEEILRSDLLSTVNDKGDRSARVTVGLYTGRMTQKTGKEEGPEPGTYKTVAIIGGQEGDKLSYTAITNRETMQQNPPDILLTNYKMLDYLLLRPKDNDVWRHNMADPELLQYLVLDELHTYDGAQGADVACLLRRLKERLAVPVNQLCVVGTSATIAGGDEEHNSDPLARLCDFASTLFEEDIKPEYVEREDRYRVEEIVRYPAMEIECYPPVDELEPRTKESAELFVNRVAELFDAPVQPVNVDHDWLRALPGYDDLQPILESTKPVTRWQLALGEWLRQQPLFHALLEETEQDVVAWDVLIPRLVKRDFAFRDTGTYAGRSQVLMAFLALVAQARELRSGRAFPLVPTQVQLWLRELRRLGAVVGENLSFSWLDTPVPDKKQLPVVHCKECGEVAWVALEDPDKQSLIEQHCQGFALKDDPQAIYQGWGFDSRPASSRLVILSPWQKNDDPIDENDQQELEVLHWYLAPTSLVVREGKGVCPLSGEQTIAVKVNREVVTQENGNKTGVRRCPHCKEKESLMFMGSRSATVSSVAIDEVFGSLLNNDPKLLAFTDSVQDASHRAGFFSSRTYHFTLRTALQHVIDEAGDDGLPLPEVGEALMAYWSQQQDGRPGSEKEVMATLMPPDLREYQPYLDFRNNPAATIPPPKLREAFIRRLNWQATSEFSLMLTHGRTMELHASATIGWDEDTVDNTLHLLKERLPGLSPVYADLTDEALKLWIYGMLHRQRERGGLYHPYLDQYASQSGLWGKSDWNGNTLEIRETYPPHGRYLPKLLATRPDKRNDHFLSPPRQGNQRPWQLVWIRRVLGLPAVDDASLVDLLTEFLVAANQSGLLHCLYQDGDKHFYALNHKAARFYARSEKFSCSESGHTVFRPRSEARFWQSAPSLSYQAQHSRYEAASLNDREKYYRDRYRKGALRRVFAYEHTGMLNTEERENLELHFNSGGRADDPNVLTATSTLEMGIDIGDLSATMLCSIPPSTASYLQRIGRAGRKTGTALVVSVINQRPHDLFFYARPDELLRGDVEPPGCWLDASAVLVRQYLAYCFDQGVREEILQDLPATGKQLIDELIVNKSGHIPKLMDWVLQHEKSLQQRFLHRFRHDVRDDTLLRFQSESGAERLLEEMDKAARAFQVQRKSLENAQNRLKEQKNKLDSTLEAEDLHEIEQEERILRSRRRKLGEITALEVLTEHGLLPNYAFPERGVRFSGSTYNRHRPKVNEKEKPRKPAIELVRAASSALRELAPGNHFYTHSHRFDIQQIDVGTRSQTLLESFAICGECGHMREVKDVNTPDAKPDCPQCGYDGPFGQLDRGQHKDFLSFHRSQAVSYMEYYESLSADSGEERENEFYTLATSFDQTIEQASGAVGEDELPFGIEYRSAMLMREVNAGYSDQAADLEFGVDKKVPATGFEICLDCGVIAPPPGTSKEKAKQFRHRRSCIGHRDTMQRRREGKPGDAYKWVNTYLHRELRSEAIRLLLPDVEPEDLVTLEAAIYLGLKLRFQGNPAHLLVKQQVIPDHRNGITRHYLVLMDAVPGGTGFLKALYQDNDQGKSPPAEGVMAVLRLALNALETCECRRLTAEDDTDGCYRCIRTYHMQFKAEDISSERGIRLLRKLLSAGEKRVEKESLDEVKVTSLFGSVLEKRFINRLQEWVESKGSKASWRSTIISGTEGFEFSTGDGRLWRIELQPLLNQHHGVAIQCQPDFILRCDDPDVRPVVIFTDGFEFHVEPEKEQSRLADDLQKRRAILESEQYLVWSITWQDLQEGNPLSQLSFLQKQLVTRILPPFAQKQRQSGQATPAIEQVCGDPFSQLKAFIDCPVEIAWQGLSHHIAGFSLLMLAGQGMGQDAGEMNNLFALWRQGYSPPALNKESSGDWVWLSRLGLTEDLLVYGYGQELVTNDFTNLRVAIRLDDSQEMRQARETYLERWRQFLAMMNLFQFSRGFIPFVISELELGTAPDISVRVVNAISGGWLEVIEDAVPSLLKLVRLMAEAGKQVPEVEFFNDELTDDLFAELAWPDLLPPMAILTGDQASFSGKWQEAGWQVVTDGDIKNKGDTWIMGLIPGQES